MLTRVGPVNRADPVCPVRFVDHVHLVDAVGPVDHVDPVDYKLGNHNNSQYDLGIMVTNNLNWKCILII